MAGIGDVINWLRGTPPEQPLNLGLQKAPALQNYPTQADADFARNYGFGDNSINEDYLNNNKARVFGEKQTFKVPAKGGKSETREMFLPMSAAGQERRVLPIKNEVVDLNQQPALQGNLRNVMMQAALAANRSPIAAMGFDPSRVTVDTEIKNPSLGGTYQPRADMAYAAGVMPDAVVHESTHRGFQKLREKYPEQVDRILGKMPNEEYIVRWLMHSKGGDPENTGLDEDMKQRQIGIDNFGEQLYPMTGQRNRDALNKLEELAIQDRLTRSRRSGPQ